MNQQVMVVDDDSSIRMAVKELLESENIKVSEAAGGKECLEALEQGFKGVILMDIMMPVMDGWDTIREIVNSGYQEGNVIFMLTAKDDPGEKMEGLETYVTDYVVKPFDPDRLVTTVEEYLSYLQ